mmetsp:Transcript_29540/g.63582  ORF Transcript_29540/g.63582 Transcript_29540/m.63582 type:complete len:94 (-) Transcript_29540:11-292(-)
MQVELNLNMLPGGLAEIFTARPYSNTVVWKRRVGLCKLALQTGARLTPMYIFGGYGFYYQSLTSDSVLARLPSPPLTSPYLKYERRLIAGFDE